MTQPITVASHARRILVYLVLAALIAGCGGDDDERQITRAFESMQAAMLEKDYGAAWELMDAGSQQAIGEQLGSFQNPGSSLERELVESALPQMGLSLEGVQDLDARDYFIAMLRGLDRVQPELREKQIMETRGRTIVELAIEGDRAVMTTKNTSGSTEAFTWLREGGDWKCVATSVGEGARTTYTLSER